MTHAQLSTRPNAYLWDLADYRVSSVQAGVIWLLQRMQRNAASNENAVAEVR